MFSYCFALFINFKRVHLGVKAIFNANFGCIEVGKRSKLLTDMVFLFEIILSRDVPDSKFAG